MEILVSFYNNLFVIEVTVFGIIAATIFVFLQIVYSQFSYREVTVIFKNAYLIFYLLLSTLTLLLTAAGSLLLSFPANDFIPKIDVGLRDILMNGYTALILLLSFFISLILFVLLTLTNLRYIRPSTIALLIGKKIKVEQIRNFLLKKYGIPAPDGWIFFSKLYKDIPTDDLLIDLPIKIWGKKKPKVTKEKKADIELKKKEAEKRLAEYKDKYERIKSEVEHFQNPFESLDALFLKAINAPDFKTLDEACLVLTEISERFIESYKADRHSDEWSPDDGIVEKYLKHLIEAIQMYIDMCDRQRLEVGKMKILEISKNITPKLLARNNQTEIKTILVFWKEVADKAVDNSPQVFSRIMRFYRELGDHAFDKGIDENREWLDEVFRHLGWLGERLLSKKGIEKKPIIWDDYYSTEYDQLFNTLFSYSYEFNNKYPESYPLIYFDAVYVIFLQLIPIYKKSKNTDVKNNIFDCAYRYASFAREAIIKGNSEGAALATLNLKQCYEKLVDEGLEDSAKDTIGLLVEIGGYAAGNKNKLVKGSFLGKSLEEYVMEIIESSPFRSTISSEIMEVYIKGGGDRSAIWEFIKILGKRMGTNFGFMFDWETGELYSEDDPRRR